MLHLKQEVSDDGQIVSEHSVVQRSAAGLSIGFIHISMTQRHQQFHTTQVTPAHCQMHSRET